jgi:hypothetical protein
MKVYEVYISDANEPWNDAWSIGAFSTREKAEESGKHYCNEFNQQNGEDIRWFDYSYKICEIVIDSYHIENLSPLAKAMSEPKGEDET